MIFPIWYLQQVLDYRTDVRVLHFDQLNFDTHIDNAKNKLFDSNPIDFGQVM